jgi:hypothetical protein
MVRCTDTVDLEQHEKWRNSLDDFLAAFVRANPNRPQAARNISYMELMLWSHKMTGTDK